MALKLKKITGTSSADTINGTADADSINGGSGADTMVGGLGNDTYVVDNAGDVVTENASEGIDTVQSSITYTLGSNLEYLTLTGKAAINGTGNELDNLLTGNTADNTLDGGLGNDTLAGGKGNDTYIVDSSGDTITESGNSGTDTVKASVTYTLSNNVENLTLTGSANINATGNSSANTLTGNTGNNQLSGGDGNDTLVSSSGSDTLMGGNGKDIFVFTDLTTSNKANGVDYITDINTSQDKIDIDNAHMAYIKSLRTTVSGSSGHTTTKQGNPDTIDVSSASSVDTIYASVNGNATADGVAFVHVLSGSLSGYYVLLNDSTAGISTSDALIGIAGSGSLTASMFM